MNHEFQLKGDCSKKQTSIEIRITIGKWNVISFIVGAVKRKRSNGSEGFSELKFKKGGFFLNRSYLGKTILNFCSRALAEDGIVRISCFGCVEFPCFGYQMNRNQIDAVFLNFGEEFFAHEREANVLNHNLDHIF